MNLDRTTSLRNLSGKISSLFFILFFLAAVDGLISVFRQPVHVFVLLPGESTEIAGALQWKVEKLSDLEYTAGSDRIQFTFIETKKGFWSGGYMWRGRLAAATNIEPGEYTLAVTHKGEPLSKALPVYVVKIYRDQEEMSRDSTSFIQRTLAVSPWVAGGAMALMVLLSVFTTFLLARRRDRLLVEGGQAEIYHVVREKSGYVISFGMGTEHGIQRGTPITILDESGMPVCDASVEKALARDSMATVALNCSVRPGYVVWAMDRSPRNPSGSG